MTELYGWLNGNSAKIDIDSLGILKKNNAEQQGYWSNENTGIFQNLSHAGFIDNHAVAYIGNPVWSDENLKSIAGSKGHLHALVAAYNASGRGFLQYLQGDFAIAIVDVENNNVFLAIDRFGIQRLAYTALSGFAFSDSIDALKNHPGVTTNISSQAIYDYVYFHMVPSPNSIYEGIQKLGPAQCLEYKDGVVILDTYWKPVFREDTTIPPDVLGQELISTLSDAVESRVGEGQQTGAFLSGGLDSSTVCGLFAKFSKPARTYTIGFDAKGFDETEYARLASEYFGTQHNEYYVTPEDVVDAIPKIAEAYDEPFGNSSAIPAFYCAKNAKADGCTVLLAGDGGDEIFAGNERYSKQKVFDFYFLIPSVLRKLLEFPFETFKQFCKLPFLSKVDSYIRQANISLPDRMESYNFLHHYSPDKIFKSTFLEKINTSAPVSHLRDYYNQPDSASNLNRMLYLDWKKTLADNDLRKVNEMCKLAGIPVVYPMLDDRVIELSCKIPSKLKIKRLKLRYFYKYAVRDFLPSKILNKSKHGFGLPFGVWMKDHSGLQELAYGNIEALKKRNFFNPDFLDEAIVMHRKGHASYYGELVWILMMLELWLDSHTE